MKYKMLGSTGVRVSCVGLGTATFGVAPTDKEADEVVGRAVDLGVNLIDCANSYGNQSRFDREGAPPAAERRSAEELLGAALKGRRNQVVLCSKVMEPVGGGPNDRGLSRLHIFAQVEKSLRRFGTDFIDIYHAHHPDNDTPIEETLRAFDDLVRQGKIRYGAVSTFGAAALVEALWVADRRNFSRPVCNQIPYNLAARGAEREVLPVCEKNGIAVTVFSPLMGGLFAGTAGQRVCSGNARWGGRGFNERELTLAKELENLAQRHSHSSASLALAWLIAQPAVASVIIGPESVQELEQSVAGSKLDLSSELLKEVDAIGKLEMTSWG